MTKKESDNHQIILGRINRGSIADQKAWKFVRELNSFSEERLNSTALIDGRREYTYRQLFRCWDRYAEVFNALGISEKNGSRVGMTGNISAECIIAFYALNMLGVSVSMIPIDGKPYICTYDLVSTPGDGSLTYAGRMNRFFVNKEGIEFNAGLIETALSAQPGIESCCITPGYDKSMHDTIPVLNLSVTDNGSDAVSIVEEALIKVFIDDGAIKDTNLPGQCLIADSLPVNESGKADARKIRNGKLKGRLYRIRPERGNGILTDIELVPFRDAPGLRSGLPDELEN